MQPQVQQALKTTGDVTALSALGGYIAGLLPSIATAVTIVWFSVLLTEKFTGKPLHELVRCAWNKLRGR